MTEPKATAPRQSKQPPRRKTRPNPAARPSTGALVLSSIGTVLVAVLRAALWVFLGLLLMLILILLLLLGSQGGRAWTAQQGILVANQYSDWYIQARDVRSPSLTEWEVGSLRVFPPGLDQAAVQVDALALAFPINQWEVAFTIDHLTAERVTVDLDRLREMTPGEPEPDEPLALDEDDLPEAPGYGFWLNRLAIGDLHVIDRQGTPLRGAVEGSAAWPGSTELPVFALTWQDAAAPLLQLSGQPSDDGRLWELRADTRLPPGTWAHNLTQWPADTPLEATVTLDADLGNQVFLLREASLPWQGHRVSLDGELRGDGEGAWTLSDSELRIDDHISRLQGRYAPGETYLEGDLDIPLMLAQPFLPDTLRDDTVQPGDLLSARIEWSETAPWSLSATLDTHWFERDLQASLAARGSATAITELTASVDLNGSTLDAAGDWDLSTHHGSIRVTSDLAADVGEPFFADPVFGGARVDGMVLGQGVDDDGAAKVPHWSGRVTARGLLDTNTNLAAIPWEASTQTGVQYPRARWRDLTVDLEAGGQKALLSSEGEINLDDLTLAAQWELDELPINSIMQALGAWPDDLTASVSGRGSVTGPVDSPRGIAQLDANGLFMGERWQANVLAPVLSTEQILVESATADWRNSRFSAAMSLRPDLDNDWSTWPVQADVAPVQLDLDDARLLVDPEAWPRELTTGEVISSLSVRGVLGDPDIMAQTRINARYQEEALTGSLNWQADNLQADFNWQDRLVSVVGQGRPWDSGAWTISAENISTRDVEPWVELPEPLLAADLRHGLTLDITGGVQAGEAAFTSSHAGAWESEALTANSDANVRWGEDGLQDWVLEGLEVNWGDASVTATANSRTTDILPAAFDVVLADFPIQLFVPIPDLEAIVSGRASLDADWPAWALNVDLDIDGQHDGQAILGDIAGQVQGTDAALARADLTALDVRIGDTTSITGDGGLQDGLWNLAIDWEGLNWRPPADFPLPDEAWNGNGYIRLAGEGDDPDVDVHTEWRTDWTTADADEELTLTFSTQLATTENELTLTTGLRQPTRDLMVAGVDLPRMPLGERLAMDWNDWDIDGFWEIDVRTEALFFWLGQDQVQVSGPVVGEGVVTGTAGTPNITTSLRWENGMLRIPQINAEFDRIDFELSADSATRVDINGTARAGRGSLDIAGDISLEDGIAAPDISLNLDRAAVVQRPDVESLASGDLSLTGSGSDLLLAGELRLEDLVVNINRLAGPAVPQLEIADEQVGEDDTAPIPLALDIGIATGGAAVIRGSGLDAQLSGQFRLGGTIADLETDGALTIESGTFNLLTRQFDLQEGQVRVVDEAVDLNLVAVHQRRDVMIEVTISGSPENLRMQLRSEPSLPEDEIIAQLLFGKAVENMTPFQALQLAGAVNQLRGGDSLDLLLATRETLGLDTLEIDPAEADDEAATLRVGRYLNSRVYLEFDTELGDDRDWQGTIEIELTPNLNLETYTGSGGRSGGLELRWRRDY